MNFLDELKWRGMLHDHTPGVEAELSKGMMTGYIGFDPTAPSLTIGNYVQIMLLDIFQRAGHQPIVLMGGATGRIGDPSGKDAERDLKSPEELDSNLNYQAQLMKKYLNFEEGANRAKMVNNLDFYSGMNVLDFLRDVGKTLTVNYMMSKESVKKRVDSGLSFTEFSYQLLQAYDFQCLYGKHNCSLQMGGSDQWGNITSGTEFIRRNLGGKAYAVTTPLLTKTDGSKFGKSEKGNLWVDEKLTSPYEFYQFWINADDSDLPKFIRYFTFKSWEEVESLETEFSENPRKLKEILAEELTIRIHSQAAYESAKNVSKLIFDPRADKDALLSLDADSLKMVSAELISYTVDVSILKNGVSIIDLMTDHTGMVSSKGDARRAIKGNAVSVNKYKIQDHEHIVTQDTLLHGKYIMVENGKKNKFMVIAN